VIEHFGTQSIPRLRVGIGAAPGEATGHVLGRFALEEKAAVEQSLDRALDAISCVREMGLEAAMNAYN
jgi:PTH1 family peptidyl-tRNA hydrolase